MSCNSTVRVNLVKVTFCGVKYYHKCFSHWLLSKKKAFNLSPVWQQRFNVNFNSWEHIKMWIRLKSTFRKKIQRQYFVKNFKFKTFIQQRKLPTIQSSLKGTQSKDYSWISVISFPGFGIIYNKEEFICIILPFLIVTKLSL